MGVVAWERPSSILLAIFTRRAHITMDVPGAHCWHKVFGCFVKQVGASIVSDSLLKTKNRVDKELQLSHSFDRKLSYSSTLNWVKFILVICQIKRVCLWVPILVYVGELRVESTRANPAYLPSHLVYSSFDHCSTLILLTRYDSAMCFSKFRQRPCANTLYLRITFAMRICT